MLHSMKSHRNHDRLNQRKSIKDAKHVKGTSTAAGSGSSTKLHGKSSRHPSVSPGYGKNNPGLTGSCLGSTDSRDETQNLNDINDYEELKYREIIVGRTLWDLPQPTKPVLVKRLYQIRNEGKSNESSVHPEPKPKFLLSHDPPSKLTVYRSDSSSRCRELLARSTETVLKRMQQKHGLAKQVRALKNWNRHQAKSRVMIDCLSKAINMPTNSLYLSGVLPLPPLENHRGPSYGPENDFPQLTDKQRFWGRHPFVPDFLGTEERPLLRSMPWTERALYKPPHSIVKSDLGKEGMHKLGFRKEWSSEEQEISKIFIDGLPLRMGPTSKKEASMMDIEVEQMKSTIIKSCPAPIRHFPGIEINDYRFVWKQSRDMDVVEVGVVCKMTDAGTGVGQIHLRNISSCCIHYSWFHIPRDDSFCNGRYRASCFIFNCSDGVLLSLDEVYITVKFKSDLAGSWTERWLLLTTPKVGYDGKIPINLYGQALESDDNKHAREMLQAQLEQAVILRIVQQSIDELIRFLPLSDDPYRKALAEKADSYLDHKTLEDQVAVFMKRNPGIKFYFSTAVQSLVHVHTLLGEETMSRHSSTRFEDFYPVMLQASDSFTSIDYPRQKSVVSRTETPEMADSSMSISIAVNKKKKGSPKRHKKFKEIKDDPKPLVPVESNFSVVKAAKKVRKLSLLGKDGVPKELKKERKKTIWKSSPEHEYISLPHRQYQSIGAALQSHQFSIASLNVDEMYRSALALEPDKAAKQDTCLSTINTALTQTSHPRVTPIERNKHYIYVFEALAQTMDSIQSGEARLRQQLGLAKDPSFTRRATFPVEPPVKTDRKFARKGTRYIDLKMKSAKPRVEDEVNWTAPKPHLYHEKLWNMIHWQLQETLCNLFTICPAKLDTPLSIMWKAPSSVNFVG